MSDKTRMGIIMAGGTGERFWPLSRSDHPKQLLALADDNKSMLDQAVDRLRPVVGENNIFVATGKTLQEPIRKAVSAVPAQNVIAEPCKRNTAGCLCYAAAHLLSLYEEQEGSVTMGIVTADHNIPDQQAFQQTTETALKAAEKNDCIVTVGIRPTRPETGYGYIEMGEGETTIEGSSKENPVHPVENFREKPDLKTAKHFLDEGRFLWNSGMFFWRLKTFLEELKTAQPEMEQKTREMGKALGENDHDTVEQIFSEFPDISIDYALMENASRVLVVPAAFSWDDVGAWDALDRTMAEDADGNVAIGDPVLINTSNSVVYNHPDSEEMAVAVLGMQNVAVVTSRDGVLVVPKDQAQDVKKAVKTLKERGSTHL